MIKSIAIGSVLSEINAMGSVFSLEYRKVNGDYGKKERCTLRSTDTNVLNERKKRNRSGIIKLRNLDKGIDFELYIDLLQTFNGINIDFLA
jgi:hypothetical protein